MFDYKSSTIRLKLPLTGEIFNIGVILEDIDGKRAIKTIDNFQSLSKCLYIENANGYNYVLQKIHTYYNKKSFTFGAFISNTIYIESQEWITSELTIEKEIDKSFDELVSINFLRSSRKISQYSSQSIVTKLKNMAESKSMKNISFRKNIKKVLKKIDTITLDKDRYYVAAEVCSIHNDNFIDHWSMSIVALNHLKDIKLIKAAMMYLPKLDDIISKKRDSYNYAKEYTQKNGILVIDSKYPSEFLGEIEKTSKRYGISLL